jgi:hypothetical protein
MGGIMQRLCYIVTIGALCCSALTANAQVPCKSLDSKAEPKFRYLLCSDGLYDRKTRGLLIELKGGKVHLPIAQSSDREFKAGTVQVPDRYPFSYLTADGSKALAWTDENGFLFFSYGFGGAGHVATYIVATNMIDQSGLSIGSPVPKLGCEWGEGTQTCSLTYAQTNQNDNNYALVEKGRIAAFVLTYQTSQEPPTKSVSSQPVMARRVSDTELNKSVTWPLGPSTKTADDNLNRTITKLRATPGKNDILGLSPGMTYDDALNVLKSVKDISRVDGRCEVFAFSSDAISEFVQRGQNLSCSTKDGRLGVFFTPNTPTKRITSVALDFPSGASALEMVENVTARFGGTPKDASQLLNCDGVRDNGIGFPMAAYSKTNGEYDKCLSENKQRKNSLVKWSLPNGLAVTLERQERYYDDVSKSGFKLTLESPEIENVDQNAGQANARSLNSQPELTASQKDLAGIFPGMRYDQIVQAITSHGYYIRPLSQAPIVDAFGRVRPYCSDPDEISNRRGSRLKCAQNAEQEFEFEFGFTRVLTPPILSSVQLNFESGLDEMIAYVADKFGALPTKVTNYEGAQTAVWNLSGNLELNLQQKERHKWSISLSDLNISETDKKAAIDSQRMRNVRPKF